MTVQTCIACSVNREKGFSPVCNLRDLDFINKSETRDLKFETETRDFKFMNFAEIVQKIVVITSKLNFV